MIPKVIHYCWFGGNPLPELAVKCIESWEKYFPDYEIKRWDETNFDISCCAYVKEAYAEKMWAFVSDYARFWILYKEGGLYFDTDVEVIRSFDDILAKGAFMGCEHPLKGAAGKHNNVSINCAPGLGLGASPGLSLYGEILYMYENIHFLDSDGRQNKKTVVQYVTELLKVKGFHGNGSIECIEEIRIYPTEYFCPMRYDTGETVLTEKTHSIHHYSASWYTEEERRVHQMEQSLKKKFGYRISVLYTVPYRLKWKIEKLGIRGTFMFIIRKFFYEKSRML